DGARPPLPTPHPNPDAATDTRVGRIPPGPAARGGARAGARPGSASAWRRSRRGGGAAMSRPVRRALVLLVCGLAPAQPGAVHAPRAGARSPECAEARFVPGEPAADLYCIALLPTDAAPAASGTAELRWVPTPFGTAVTRDGEHVHRVRVTARGLPEPSSLGPYTTYIAWATTPVLDPVVKLGVVDGEAGAEGLVAFNKFLVLVTAEASPDVEE